MSINSDSTEREEWNLYGEAGQLCVRVSAQIEGGVSFVLETDCNAGIGTCLPATGDGDWQQISAVSLDLQLEELPRLLASADHPEQSSERLGGYGSSGRRWRVGSAEDSGRIASDL
jgi:hypothetical protein